MKRWSVGDVMTRDVVTVTTMTHYRDVVELLTTRAISAVPVVDGDGRVAGVLSEADLLHKMEFAGAEPFAGFLERKDRRIARAKSDAELAGDLMTAPAVVISPVESLTTAARLMDARRIRRLPVLDRYSRLVGIVARRDLLAVYLRDDETIRREVAEQVLVRTLWIEPGSIEVIVDRGIVALAGTVDRRSTIDLAVRLVHSVAGVVDVANHLSYHLDDTTGQDHRHIGARKPS